MGKRQHQKDKLYLTYTEWTTLYGGKVEGPEKEAFRRMPYNHCCVSLQPFKHPYCDKNGNIFELEPLLAYLKKFKHNPVTGEPLEFKQLIKLNFYRNSAGEYHCPVLYKPFTKHSHLVAISVTGNVYCYEAIEQLNIKNKNWKDLLTDEPFRQRDIIVLQDPMNLTKFNLSQFHHIKNDLRVIDDEELAAQIRDPKNRLKTVSHETRDILDELNREYKPVEEKKPQEKPKMDKFNAASYSTGMVAAGFTSTVMEPVTHIEPAIIHEDIVRYQRVKKKGYVRLNTNLGQLNLQLHCDLVPKTCENFIKLCDRNYYDNTIFHRSIRNFMIQGGDPTGTGTGGESIWGKEFKDEFRSDLVHEGRGVLSMANSGPNTNKSQFFITYRSCTHLNNKHTVFGQVVGGKDVLTQMEQIEVDNKDKPIEDIIILKTHIFVDPYQEADEQLAAERAEEEQKKLESMKSNVGPKTAVLLHGEAKTFKSGIGKYINPDLLKSEEFDVPQKKKKTLI